MTHSAKGTRQQNEWRGKEGNVWAKLEKGWRREGGGGGKEKKGALIKRGVSNPLPTMRIPKKLRSKGCKIIKKMFKICIFTLLLRIQTLKMGSRRSKKWNFLITLWNNQVGLICSTCFTSPQIFVKASLDYCAPNLLDETILISISCVL